MHRLPECQTCRSNSATLVCKLNARVRPLPMTASAVQDNQRLAQLQAWLEERHTEMRGLGDWLRAHLRIPEPGSLHITLPNIQLGASFCGSLAVLAGDGADWLLLVLHRRSCTSHCHTSSWVPVPLWPHWL